MRFITSVLLLSALCLTFCEDESLGETNNQEEYSPPTDTTAVTPDSLSNCLAIDASTSFNEDTAYLFALGNEILALSTSQTCTDSSQWRYTPLGAKACGGPDIFIAYSLALDTGAFLEKVRCYTEYKDYLNEKWGLASDCSVPPEPDHIICVGGEPQFVY